MCAHEAPACNHLNRRSCHTDLFNADRSSGLLNPQGPARRGLLDGLGGRVDDLSIPATLTGFAELLAFCERHIVD